MRATQQLSDLIQATDTTSQAASDSVSSISNLGEGIRSVGGLLLEGRWGTAWDRLQAGAYNWAADFIPDLLSAIFVGLVAWLVFRLVFTVVSRAMERTGAGSSGLRDLVVNGLNLAGWSIVVLLALSQMGLDLATAAAGLGILGLALGFAAKDALENLIAGVMIMVDRPFRVGDFVEVEDERGTVTRFTLRSTRIRTLENRIVVMPNMKMVNQKLINHSGRRMVRIDIPFGIAYKESIAEARDVVLAELDGDERVLGSPDPEVVAVELNDSSVDLELRFFTADASQEQRLRIDFIEKIRTALGEADIEIPFPHLQLFVDGAKALAEDGVRIRGDGASRPDDDHPEGETPTEPGTAAVVQEGRP